MLAELIRAYTNARGGKQKVILPERTSTQCRSCVQAWLQSFKQEFLQIQKQLNTIAYSPSLDMQITNEHGKSVPSLKYFNLSSFYFLVLYYLGYQIMSRTYTKNLQFIIILTH